MPRDTPLPFDPTATWTYGLVGGLLSVPLSIALYWQSGLGPEFSLNPVFLGGAVAGVLAVRGSTDPGSAGARAGLVGGVPATLWLLSEVLAAAAAGLGGPLPFRLAATGLAVALGLLPQGLGVLAGLIGGKVGGWLARTVGGRRATAAGN